MEMKYLVVEDLATPFQIATAGTHQGGIITDIVMEIFKGTHIQVKPITFPVKRLHRYVRSGEPGDWIAYDAKVWNTLEDVGEFIDVPLFTVRHSFLTCAPPPTSFDEAATLTGAQIAILGNFNYPELEALSSRDLLTLVPVENYLRGFNLAINNRVSGFVEMEIRLKYNLKKLEKQSDCLTFVDFSPVIPPYDIFLVMSNSASQDTREFVSNKVRRMRNSGVIDRILGKYRIERNDIPPSN